MKNENNTKISIIDEQKSFAGFFNLWPLKKEPDQTFLSLRYYKHSNK